MLSLLLMLLLHCWCYLWLVVQLLTVESIVVLTLNINVCAMTFARVVDAGGRLAPFGRAAGAAPEHAAAGAPPTLPRGSARTGAAPGRGGPTEAIGSSLQLYLIPSS